MIIPFSPVIPVSFLPVLGIPPGERRQGDNRRYTAVPFTVHNVNMGELTEDHNALEKKLISRYKGKKKKVKVLVLSLDSS